MEKAKATAIRAVKTIDKKLEDEQLNVWSVLLKMVVQQGTQEEIDETFKEANIVNCSFKIHSKMAEIYNECNKIEVLFFK